MAASSVRSHGPSPRRGIHLVRRRDVHDAGDDDWCALNHPHVVNRKEPLSGQPFDIVPVDLVERAVTIRGVVAVIGRPVDVELDPRLAVVFPLSPKEVDASVGRPDLCVEAALVEDAAAERAPIGKAERPRSWLWRTRVASGGGDGSCKPSEICDEGVELFRRNLKRRHAFRGHSLCDDRRELVRPSRKERREDRAGPIGASTIATMAQRAAGLVRVFAISSNQTQRCAQHEDGNKQWDSHLTALSYAS